MKKISALVLMTALVMGATTANAAPLKNSKVSDNSVYTKQELTDIKENLLGVNVEENVANQLIEKLENGILLDAMVMDPTDPNVQVEYTKTGNDEVTRYTFPDGSVAISSIEDGTQDALYGDVSLEGISGGSCYSGSGYTYCTDRKVSYQLATYGYSFYADYQNVQGAYDKITWAGNWNVWVAGGTYSNPSMRIVKGTETSTGKAEARLSATLNASDFGSLTRSLSLRVGADSSTYTWNAYY